VVIDTIIVNNYGLKYINNWYNNIEVIREPLKEELNYNLVNNLKYFNFKRYKEVKKSVKSLYLLIITTSLTGQVLLPIIYGLIKIYSVKHIIKIKGDFFTKY